MQASQNPPLDTVLVAENFPSGPLEMPWMVRWKIMTDSVNTLKNWRKSHGRIFSVFNDFRFRKRIVLADARLIEPILGRDSQLFLAGAAVAPLLNSFVGPNSILNIDGDAHKKQRTMVLPMLSKMKSKAYATQMLSGISTSIQQLKADYNKKQEWFSLEDFFAQATLQIFVDTVFGVEMRERNPLLFTKVFEFLSFFHPSYMFFPFMRWPLSSRFGYGKFLKARSSLGELLKTEIAYRKVNKIQTTDVLPTKNLLSEMIHGEQALSEAESVDLILTLLLAGHETTALTLTWCWVHLYQNPKVKQKLLDELALLPDSNSNHFMAELDALPYLDAVICESLRIGLVVPAFWRIPQKDYQLGAYHLPAGTMISVSPVLIHTDPEYYPEPDLFRPERFIENPELKNSTRFVPFGGGHRRCVGNFFSVIESKVIISQLLTQVNLVFKEGQSFAHARRIITLAPRDRALVKVI